MLLQNVVELLRCLGALYAETTQRRSEIPSAVQVGIVEAADDEARSVKLRYNVVNVGNALHVLNACGSCALESHHTANLMGVKVAKL